MKKSHWEPLKSHLERSWDKEKKRKSFDLGMFEIFLVWFFIILACLFVAIPTVLFHSS